MRVGLNKKIKKNSGLVRGTATTVQMEILYFITFESFYFNLVNCVLMNLKILWTFFFLVLRFFNDFLPGNFQCHSNKQWRILMSFWYGNNNNKFFPLILIVENELFKVKTKKRKKARGSTIQWMQAPTTFNNWKHLKGSTKIPIPKQIEDNKRDRK